MLLDDLLPLYEFKAFIEYKDPYERFNVYLMLDTRRYVAKGLGDHEDDIPPKMFWTVEDAIEHAETVLGDYEAYELDDLPLGEKVKK